MDYLKKHFNTIAAPLFLGILLTHSIVVAQEQQVPQNARDPFHNQLFFNRFLINPTFSLVRENKSYLNVLLRNQYAGFEDNNQNYFLGFSNKLDENTALGLGIYGQWSGVIQEFGFHANYATAVKLGEKSALSFGANVNYRSQGLDRNRVVVNQEDPLLNEVEKINSLSIEPGLTLSLGKWDFGMYFTDMVRYNQTNEELATNFGLDYLRPQLQYTHTFKRGTGLFEDARLIPLVQAGRDINQEWSMTGSLLMDVPKMGWLQASYDQRYGLSSGLGFNLNKRLSLGYLMEKSLTEQGENLGWNHELSLAYTMNDELRGTGINVQLASNEDDEFVDEIVRNYEEQLNDLKQKMDATPATTFDEASLAYQNRMLIDELILRQDSIEELRNQMFEKRFESMVRLLRREIQQNGAKPESRSRGRFHSVQTGIASTDNTVRSKNREERFEEFNEIPIKAKNRSDAIGVNSGFYLIANVFKNKSNVRSFMKDLSNKGLEARQFYNKENGLHYVYLADFNSKDDADVAIISDLDGAYKDDKWIMEVYNTTQTADIGFEME
ncbi:PorP/SprF family type IX secretion system membrane protein [Muricauda sp. SCSIO 64092]|uniref:PorP/SprF family type IX secretion system membrane protein n=1 Tax=Allomuricauda sp. SCSIO 64092 TaxID=2908842 RepID=UPI001FF21BE5|nr:PorP/SprF family type IX secretion system membrane protein [Muricauda sp. SCSIO 64092]UOY06830.1 PorP/SprF family type IX secretion system membrane protein [Muricauda sp. SCSIO 64092]